MTWATVMSGHADLADICFLIAFIVALLAAAAYALEPPRPLATVLLALAVAATAFGLMAL